MFICAQSVMMKSVFLALDVSIKEVMIVVLASFCLVMLGKCVNVNVFGTSPEHEKSYSLSESSRVSQIQRGAECSHHEHAVQIDPSEEMLLRRFGWTPDMVEGIELISDAERREWENQYLEIFKSRVFKRRLSFTK